MKPLSYDLNRMVLAMAPRFEARARAPATLRELMDHAATGTDPVVWEGASDATPYGDPRINHAFRAWHDATHAAGAYDFTLAGERATCERQIADMLARYPGAATLARIIRAEIIGQAEYAAMTGAFPLDQAAFVRDYLARCGE